MLLANRFAPVGGALLDVQPVSDIIRVRRPTPVRPNRGQCWATVKSLDKVILVSVRASAFPGCGTNGDAMPVEEVSASAESGNRTEFVSEDLVSPKRPELAFSTREVVTAAAL